MFDKIDFKNLSKKAYYIGNLEQKIIALLQVNIAEGKILIDVLNIKHAEKHKCEFQSEEEYIRHMEHLTDIIQNPDYIGLHPDGTSIQFIKKIDEVMILAIRIRSQGPYWVRTVFPITLGKLQTYIDAGTLKKC
jgi:hypothetical protein